MSLSAEAFTFVADLVRRRSAIQLTPGKEYLVESRLLPLARAAGLDLEAYIVRLRTRSAPQEVEAVVEAMTTNETSWFRDGAPYAALRETELPRLVAARGGVGRLRVWSAACSTGQEPFSVAMTLLDHLPTAMSSEIVATDLSEQVLGRARSGRYSQLEVNRGLPAPLLVRHMVRAGTEWELSAAVRQMVSFRAHNLLDTPPPGPFDVVLLRNVLIYFDLATKRAILDRVLRVLKPDGALLLGAAETTLGVHEGWERVTVGRTSVYRPHAAARPAHAPALPTPRPSGFATPTVPHRAASAVPQPRGAVR